MIKRVGITVESTENLEEKASLGKVDVRVISMEGSKGITVKNFF